MGEKKTRDVGEKKKIRVMLCVFQYFTFFCHSVSHFHGPFDFVFSSSPRTRGLALETLSCCVHAQVPGDRLAHTGGQRPPVEFDD